jgi:acyl carrier protein
MATELTPTEKTIRDFILKELLYDRQLDDLGPDDMLLDAELLDSMAILQTVTFCEQIFEISIPDEELFPNHFESLRAIGQLVERRIAERGASNEYNES